MWAWPVLLDARTFFLPRGVRLLPCLAMLDGARTLPTILWTLLRIRWWQGGAASSRRELDVAFAAARCGAENNCNGHLLEFKNSLLAAESGYSLHCLNSLNSLICHPSMHAPSLASGLFVRECWSSWGGGVARWLGTARVDGLLHAGFNLFLHALIH